MVETLRIIGSFVVGIFVVELIVYLFHQWFIDYVSPPNSPNSDSK
jgi:hypothetical protein